jgi:hypothetical protein
MLLLGRALVALYLAARPRATKYVHAGSKFVLAGFASIEIGTRFARCRSSARWVVASGGGARPAIDRSTARSAYAAGSAWRRSCR